MTRFAAEDPDERRTLFADAIAAHRERGSPYVTFETGDAAGKSPCPWIQFSAEEGLINLDCTDAEVDEIEAVVEEFGGATIADRVAPESAAGINLKIAIHGDDARVAMLIESLFEEGFGRASGYRAWVVEI